MAFQLIDRIAVEDEGEGPAVVCVHGLGGSSNTWTPLMPALARHRVIRVDLPGSGRSQRAEGALSIERYVEALLDVCARLNVTRAHWLGHSMGTIVCQHIAAGASEAGAQRRAVRPADRAARCRAHGDAGARREGARRRGRHARDHAGAAATPRSRPTRAQRLPVAVAFVRESLMRQDGEAYARSCEALAGAQAAAVERIEAPVLLVTGDEDGVAPPQAVRAMADKLHRAASTRVVVLPRCGHWTPIERPEECQRELRDFLATNARS